MHGRDSSGHHADETLSERVLDAVDEELLEGVEQWTISVGVARDEA
jgi:hypothetical protein